MNLIDSSEEECSSHAQDIKHHVHEMSTKSSNFYHQQQHPLAQQTNQTSIANISMAKEGALDGCCM